MPKEHLEQVSENILFFRKNLRGMNRIGIVLLFIVIGLLYFTIIEILVVKEPVYFATTSDGRLIQIDPIK